jgi:FeS assembly SUF system protein
VSAAAEDIEDLKTIKIAPARGGSPRLLPTVEVREATVTEAFGGSGLDPHVEVDRDELRERIIDAMKSIYDPEIPVNIYDLGLIYGFEIDEHDKVEITMTLTAPACPVAGILVEQVANVVGDVDGVRSSHVSLTWDPPWTRDRMTEAAMLELGLL